MDGCLSFTDKPPRSRLLCVTVAGSVRKQRGHRFRRSPWPGVGVPDGFAGTDTTLGLNPNPELAAPCWAGALAPILFQSTPAAGLGHPETSGRGQRPAGLVRLSGRERVLRQQRTDARLSDTGAPASSHGNPATPSPAPCPYLRCLNVAQRRSKRRPADSWGAASASRGSGGASGHPRPHGAGAASVRSACTSSEHETRDGSAGHLPCVAGPPAAAAP